MRRRTFLSTVTGIAASTAFPRFAIGMPGKSANSKLNVAFIGSGGWIAQQPYNQGCSEENLVAFCDGAHLDTTTIMGGVNWFLIREDNC